MAWSYEILVSPDLWSYSDQRGLDNATEVWNYFSQLGFTLEATCGILGNMWRESHLNPGQKQYDSISAGWGLIQWTPSTNLTDYISGNWYDGAQQLDVINREGTGAISGKWIPTSKYPYSWEEFRQLTSIEIATQAYLAERERAGVSALAERVEYAKKYYEYLSGQPTPPPTPPVPPGPTGLIPPVWLLFQFNKKLL